VQSGLARDRNDCGNLVRCVGAAPGEA